MSVDVGISLNTLANMTDTFSGAEIEHTANEAGLLAIKEAIKIETPTETLRISQEYFIQSINHIKKSRQTSSQTKADHQPTTILSPFQILSPAIF